MPEQTEARRMRLLEALADSEDAHELEQLASALGCDTRTVRRDLDHLQHLLQRVQNVEVRRGKVVATRAGYSPGYFTDHLERNTEAKEAIARRVAASLTDERAIALTAGSTPYAIAREMRRRVVNGELSSGLIVFTNSVPALLELVAAGIHTGVLGEIYSAEDCAFHTPEFHSAFQPGLAIVGASGVAFNSSAGTLDLYSHRAEEAAFLKQLLAHSPEILIAVDSTKLGRCHPWSFGGNVLNGKSVHLVTDALTDAQREELTELAAKLASHGTTFRFEDANDTNA